jgi:hypothetical protein
MKCKSCGAQIVFLKTAKGGFIPVDYDEKIAGDAGGCAMRDEIFDPKKHVAHFATCPSAGQWRKKK